MIDPTTKAFKQLNEQYEKLFDEPIPTEMLPPDETLEGLNEKIEQSVATGRDVLSEEYGWDALEPDNDYA